MLKLILEFTVITKKNFEINAWAKLTESRVSELLKTLTGTYL